MWSGVAKKAHRTMLPDTRALTIDSQKTIVEAAELMSLKEVGDIIVTGAEIPRGIVTERDFVARALSTIKLNMIKIGHRNPSMIETMMFS